MVKMKINITFQIPDDEFDKYCRENKIGKSTAKIGIRNLLEEKIWRYIRNLDSLVDDYHRRLQIEESGWATGNPKPISERDLKVKQYKLFEKHTKKGVKK